MKSVLVLDATAKNTRAYTDATLSVRRAVRELNKLGSSFDGPVDNAPNESTQILVWTDDSHGATVRFFADLENDVMYLQNEAPTPEELAGMEKVFRGHLSIATLDELKHDAALERDDTGHSLVRLAFGAPMDIDDEIATQLKNGLRSKDTLVRRNAGFAMVITTWPELTPDLASAAKVEEYPEVKALLTRYLEVLGRVNRRS